MRRETEREMERERGGCVRPCVRERRESDEVERK